MPARATSGVAADVVREEVLRCQALIDSLLSLARTEAGVVERDERVDLAELAEAAAARAAGRAAAHGLSVGLNVAPAVVDGDRLLLEQLVWNLVENAVIHNREAGFVEIEVGPAGADLVVRVDNSGPRVPGDATAALLEPFQRLGRGVAGGPGAGVGLSIVRAVAAAHGGSVRLSARREGGLRVEVRIRRASGANANGGLPALAEGAVATVRGPVLVVRDLDRRGAPLGADRRCQAAVQAGQARQRQGEQSDRRDGRGRQRDHTGEAVAPRHAPNSRERCHDHRRLAAR